MKRKKTQIVGLVITILMVTLFSGCSKEKKEEKTKAMGRYIEQTIELPEEIQNKVGAGTKMLKGSEGNIQILGLQKDDHSKGWLCQMDKDGNWTSESADWYVNGFFSFAYNGTELYATEITSYSEKGMEITLTKLENGEMKPALLDGKNQMKWENMVLEMYFLKDHSLVITTSEGRTIVYKEGKEILNVENTQGYTAIKENKVMIPDAKGHKMLIYDMEKNGEQTEIPFSGKMENGKLLSDNENWYSVNSMGIQRVTEGGSVWEGIVDGSLCSLNSPKYNIQDVAKGTEDEFYIMYQYGDGERELMRYLFDPNVPSLPEKDISIVSLKENKTVRQAIVEYHKQYPNIRVKYQILEGESGLTKEDAIKKLNTELLAGQGADLIILDGLPMDSYIEKGVLTDLGELAESLIAQEGLLSNVVEASKKEGKVYQLPAKIQLPIIFGKKELTAAFDSTHSLAEYARNQAKVEIFGAEMRPRNYFLELFTLLYSDQFIDKDNKINEEKFMEFLEDIKTVCDQTKALEEMEVEEEYVENIPESDMLITDSCEGIISIIKDTISLYSPIEVMKKKGTDYNYELIKGIAVPSGNIGINKKSKNQTEAADFIKVLLSKACQEVEMQDGYPVNAQAIEIWNEREDDFFISTSNFEATNPGKEKLEEFSKKCLEVKTIQDIDQNIMNMIQSGTKEYFEGKKTAKETAKEIVQKVDSYLKE